MWTRRLTRALALFAALTASGCFKATFVEPRAVATERHDEWTSFYFWGLVGEQRVDARRFCPADVALVRTGANAGTAVVSLLTLGIYMPRKVYVTCAAGAGQRIAAETSR